MDSILIKIEDLIEVINEDLENRRANLNIDKQCYFILKKNMKSHETFKGIKTYTLTLILHGDSNIEFLKTDTTLKPNSKKELKELGINFMSQLLNKLILHYNELIYCTYGEQDTSE